MLKLIELVVKKVQKNYFVEQTADMLEEDVDTISKIYRLAENMAPNYDINKIFDTLLAKPATSGAE